MTSHSLQRPVTDNALRYLRAGFSVIPVGQGKRSLVPWREFQKRLPSEDQVVAWMQLWPDHNVALICGPVSGGLAVLDIDDPDLAQRIADDVPLQAETTMVWTPRGGLHVWVIETDETSRSGPLVPGVADLKAQGGYVLAPPSSLHGRHYTILANTTIKRVPNAHEWAIGLLRAYDVEVAEKPATPTTDDECIRQGQRNTHLTGLAGVMRRRGMSEDGIGAGLVAENAARCEPPLPEREVQAIARSVARYAPADLPVNAYRGIQVGHTLPLVRLADLRQMHSGEVEWIVRGYMARGEVGFLAGAGESLKSWMAAHLSAAIDGDFFWLGVFEVQASRVLYVEQERAANLVYQLNRIEAGEGVALGSERLQVVPPCPLPLSEPEAQAALEGAIVAHKPDVVVINALRDVLGRANENSPTDMTALLGPLGRMAERHQCCILIIDHFNKAGMHGLVRGTAAHGGTAQKYNEADFVLIAERPRNEVGKGTGPATVSVAKRRSGDPGPTFAVDVTDAPKGVLVRGQVGVKALSPRAQDVMTCLQDGPSTVEAMSKRTGKSKDVIRQAIAELRADGLVDGEGPAGKAHIYWLVEEGQSGARQPTCDPDIELRVGHTEQRGALTTA